MKARPPVHSVAQVQALAVLEKRRACCYRRVWECASAPSSSPAGSQQRAGRRPKLPGWAPWAACATWASSTASSPAHLRPLQPSTYTMGMQVHG